jgi:hypothetical protein
VGRIPGHDRDRRLRDLVQRLLSVRCSTSTSAYCAGIGGVGFCVYAALGTNRYPPFTLARTGYPADFDDAYPAHLSRDLVLVK